MDAWNPWHGCKRISEGCQNCYVYDRDKTYGRDSYKIGKTKDFDLPIKKDRYRNYKIADGSRLYTCMTSDFFIDTADEWRLDVWRYIQERKGIHFTIFTKRVDRIKSCLPFDWDAGYPNVTLICSVENQKQCEARMPIFKSITAQHKMVACAPLLENINIEKYLDESIELVSACGENGKNARPCDFNWVLSLRAQCQNKSVPFHFNKTGTYLIVNEKRFFVPYAKQAEQAHKANVDYLFDK